MLLDRLAKINIISGIKPVGVEVEKFRELGLKTHFNEWIRTECVQDSRFEDWGILLKFNFDNYSRDTWFKNETPTSFGRHILWVEGVTKERIKRINTPEYIISLHNSVPQTVTKYHGIKRKHSDEHDIGLEAKKHSKHSLLYHLFVSINQSAYCITRFLTNILSLRMNGLQKIAFESNWQKQVEWTC